MELESKLDIIMLKCFSTYFQKNYTILRLEDIFRQKQSFSIHFVSCRSESSNISLVVSDKLE